METSAPLTTTLRRKVQDEVGRVPEIKGKVRAEKKRKRRVKDQKAQGDLVAEMVLREDDETVPLTAGQLLPPPGNHFEEPHPVERRIAKSAHSI